MTTDREDAPDLGASAHKPRRFVRFLAVGVLNTLFGYGVFSLLVYLGLHYSLASGISTVAGVLFNFQTIGRLVFGDGDPRKIVRFVITYGLLYLFTLAGLRAGEQLGASEYVSAAAMLAPSALLGYVLHKRFVFPPKP